MGKNSLAYPVFSQTCRADIEVWQNIAPGPQQIISSFMVLGAFLAGFCTGPMGSVLARRWCILIGVVLLVASVTVMVVTTSIGALYFSRLLMGYGNGLVMAFTMVYVSEIAPSNLRGLSYGLTSGWITIGQAVGIVRSPPRPPICCVFRH